MKKRVISLLLTLVMLFSLLPVSALAAEVDTGGDTAVGEEPAPAAEETVIDPEPEEEPEITPEPTEEPEITPEPTEEPEVTPEPTETDETTEPAEMPEEEVAPEDQETGIITVVFVLTPDDSHISVYTLSDGDEEDMTQRIVIEPEADGSYRLIPGEYYYSVEAEGYPVFEDVLFTVAPEPEVQEIFVSLPELQETDGDRFVENISVLVYDKTDPAISNKVTNPYINNYSESYASGNYFTKLQSYSITGNQNVDIAEIAKTQVGYHESNSWDKLSGSSSGSDNCTEYNRYLGMGKSAWCAVFVSWCARAANVPTSCIPKTAATNPGTWNKKNTEIYSFKDFKDGLMIPSKGDVILYRGISSSSFNYSSGQMDMKKGLHAELLYSFDGSKGTWGAWDLIGGNWGGKVNEHTYTPDEKGLCYTSKGGQKYCIYAIVRPSYTSSQALPEYQVNCYGNHSGKNYLLNTDFSGTLDSAFYSSRNTSVATLSIDASETHNGYSSLKIVNAAAGSSKSQKDLAIQTLTQGGVSTNSAGDNKDMVLSFWAKSSVAGTKMYFRWGKESTSAYRSITLSTDWQKYSVPMSKTRAFNNWIHPYVDSKGTVWLAEMQLEDGTAATPFALETAGLFGTGTAKYGGTYILPSAPVWSGHDFLGWYTAPSGGEQITPYTKVKLGNIAVYARWSGSSGGHTHTPGTPTRVNEIPPTCTADGAYDEVTSCTECGLVISSVHVAIPALGHNYQDGVCTRCGESAPSGTYTRVLSDGYYYWYDSNGDLISEAGIYPLKEGSTVKWYYVYESGNQYSYHNENRYGSEQLGDNYYFINADNSIKMTKGWFTSEWRNWKGELCEDTFYGNGDGTLRYGVSTIDRELHLFSPALYCLPGPDWDPVKEWEGNHYYCDENGVIPTGWITHSGIYAISEKPYTNVYYAHEDGTLHSGFLEYGGNTYYFDTRVFSLYQDRELELSDTAYCFDSDGVMIRNRWYTYYHTLTSYDTGCMVYELETVYAHGDGSLHTGLLEYEGDLYGFDNYWHLIRSNSYYIDGTRYEFDENGKVTTSSDVLPYIDRQPSSSSVEEGEKAYFGVGACGDDLEFQWQCRRSSTVDWEDYTEGELDEGWFGESTLSFTAGVEMNGYRFRCKVSNPVGEVYSWEAVLTVGGDGPIEYEHAWNGGVVERMPTCDEPGAITYTCLTCGAKRTEEIPVLGHIWGDWTVTKIPTCSEEGILTVTCQRDPSHTVDRILEKTAHQPAIVGQAEPTETDEGYSGDEVCSVCGAVLNLGNTIPALSGSSYLGRIALNEMRTIQLPETDGTWSLVDGQAWTFNQEENTWTLIEESPGFVSFDTGGYLTVDALPDEESAWLFKVVCLSDSGETVSRCDVMVFPIDWSFISLEEGFSEIPENAFEDNENLQMISIGDGVTWIGNNAFAGCVEDLIIVCNLGSYAAQYAGASGLMTMEFGGIDDEYFDDDDGPIPNTISIDREYMLLASGEEAESPLSILYEGGNWDGSVQWGSTDKTVAIVDELGYVTAVGTGTAYIVATITGDEQEIITAICRVDVVANDGSDKPVADEVEKTIAATGAGVTLPVTKGTLELFKTDYLRITVLLNLSQNMAQYSASAAGGNTILPQGNWEDAGFAITHACFTDDTVAELFDLRVVDDRTLEVRPKTNTMKQGLDAPKSIKGSYRSPITVWIQGREFTTPVYTMTVKKSLPAIKAKAITFNSYYSMWDTRSVEFTGGTIPLGSAWIDTTKSQPAWLVFDETENTLTYSGEPGVSLKKTTLYLQVQPVGWAVQREVAVAVSAKSTAPKLTFKPASLTLKPGTGDGGTVTWKLTPAAFEGEEVTLSRITEGKSARAADSELAVEIYGDTVNVTAPYVDGKAHTYKVYLTVAGKESAFTVKTLADKSAVSLTLKAKGAIDLTVPESPVTITATTKNYHTDQASFTVTSICKAKTTEDVQSLFNVATDGNVLKLTANGEPATGTYTATVAAYVGADEPVTKSVNFTVKRSAESKVPVSVSLKAAGSIDVLRPGTAVTLTPTVKNDYTYELTPADVKVTKTYDGTTKAKVNTDATDQFDVAVQNGKYVITEKAFGTIFHTDKFSVQATVEGATSKAVTLKVVQGKAKVTQSVKAVTLLKTDRYSRGEVVLTLPDKALAGIAKVELDAKSAALFSLTDLGNGKYAIGYAGNLITSTKAQTVKLRVFLDGNLTGTPNAMISVKVNFK